MRYKIEPDSARHRLPKGAAFAVLCGLFLPFASHASEPVEHAGNAATVPASLLVVLPNVDPLIVRQAQKTIDRIHNGKPTEGVEFATPTGLGSLEIVRLRMMPTRLATLAALPDGCPSGEALLPSLVDQTGRAIDHAFLPKAKLLLRDARVLLACGGESLQPETLGNLLFLEASWLFEDKKPVTGAIDDALGVAPSLKFPQTANVALLPEFERAQRRFSSRPTVPIAVDRSVLEGLLLLVDGQVLTADSASFVEGRHILQIATADMQVLTGTEVELRAQPDREPERWPPANLLPPSRGGFLEQLQRQLNAGELSSDMEQTLRELVRVQGLEGITLLAPGSQPSSFRELTLDRDSPLQITTLRLEPNPVAGALPWVAAGAGVCAIGAGVTYGYTWYRIKTDSFDWDEGLEILGRNHSAGATLAVCAAASLVSLGAARYWPQFRVARDDMWVSLTVPHLVLGPGLIQLQVGGVW